MKRSRLSLNYDELEMYHGVLTKFAFIKLKDGYDKISFYESRNVTTSDDKTFVIDSETHSRTLTVTQCECK